ncbi:MAG: Nuclear transport factor 2 [Chrysothrix sp. TS-e1954]|nr:MAG: Nuclear transport factor 2 [Chrysothrix sp. TS-e1954]
MANTDEVAKQFVTFYYQTFDQDRSKLAALYRDTSQLKFETNSSVGVTDIIQQLTSLPFEQVEHQVSTCDSQASSSKDNSILVLVTGKLLTGGESNALSYTQAFHLMPENNTYYVLNDVFRLTY